MRNHRRLRVPAVFCLLGFMLLASGVRVLGQSMSWNAKVAAIMQCDDEAYQAFQAGELDKAEARLQQRVGESAAPNRFALALGLVETRQGKFATAKEALENAIRGSKNLDDYLLCSNILSVEGPPGSQDGDPFAADFDRRAFQLAKSQNLLNSQDYRVLSEVATLAERLEDFESLDRVVDSMLRLYPERAGTHFLAALRAAHHQRWITAEAEVYEAGRLGMPPNQIEAFLEQTQIRRLARPWRWARNGGLLTLAVALGLVSLIVGGKVLSYLTLRAAENADPEAPITRPQAALRGIYRWVVNFAGLYYYICLPFVIGAALAIVAGSWYLVLQVNRIPVKLLILLACFSFAMLVMIWSSVKSLFTRIKREDPGRQLPEEEAPRLWDLAREVAGHVGTRPIDDIWITPGTELAVFEKGNMFQRWRDRARRGLILGEEVIDDFQVNDFRAVLAHEYGHFLHRDTAGGDMAMRVNATLNRFATSMAQAGQLEWWNIGWQYVRLYHYVFRRITHGASRLHEINADRVAARLYGREAFANGLRHVIRRDVSRQNRLRDLFGRIEDRRVKEEGNVPLWDRRYDRADARQEIERAVDKIWSNGTTEDDTHPSPIERVRLLARVNLVPPETTFALEPGDEAPRCVSELFADRHRLSREREQRLEDSVNDYFARRGQELGDVVRQINAHVDQHPDLMEPVFQRGLCHMEMRKYLEAEADFTTVISNNGPNLAEAYRGRAYARLHQGRPDEARTDFSLSIQHQTESTQHVQIERTDTLMQGGAYAEAEAEYSKFIETSPERVSLYLRRADARAAMHHFGDAEEDYTHALKLDARCAEALAGRALVRLATGRREEAVRDARAASEIETQIVSDYPRLTELLGSEFRESFQENRPEPSPAFP